MTIYEKNIQTLSRYYPEMDYNIDKAKHELKENYTIIEEKSNDGLPVLKVKKDGHCCYLGGKRNAQKPPEEWLKAQGDLCDGYTYIMLGIGNIGYLRELIEHVDFRLNIIIYEPSIQIFLKSLEWIDLEKGMKKHLIIFWVEGIGLMTLDRIGSILDKVMRLENLNKVQLFILPNYDILFEKNCESLVKKCEDTALENRVNYNTAVFFSNIDSINVMKNAKYLCTAYKTIQLYKTIPFDTTGIVVAAGPSLKCKRKIFYYRSGYGNKTAFESRNYTRYVFYSRCIKTNRTSANRGSRKDTDRNNIKCRTRNFEVSYWKEVFL